MTAEEFVDTLKLVVRDSAANVVKKKCENPSRGAAAGVLQISEWFKNLTAKDKEFVGRVANLAADVTFFQFLCVLDGVVAIESGRNKGVLELWFKKGSEQVLLNDNLLHDML